MTATSAIVRVIGLGVRQPGGRVLLDHDGWRAMAKALAETPDAFGGLWAEADMVHALLTVPGLPVTVVSVPIEAGGFDSLAHAAPGAAPFERMVRDLWGHTVRGTAAARPWLDHGAWGITRPLAEVPGPAVYPPEPPEFETQPAIAALQSHAVLRGPVRRFQVADPGEPFLLRLGVGDGAVLAAEARLGLNHRGLIGLMRGKTPQAACRIVARSQADHAVAAQLAFCRAVEAARGQAVPPDIAARRDLLLALELLAVQLLRLRQLAVAVGVDGLALRLGDAREAVVAACGVCFGHRLLMDTIAPGTALAPEQPDHLRAALAEVNASWRMLDRMVERRLLPLLEGVALVPASLATAFGQEDQAGDAVARTRRRWASAAGSLLRLDREDHAAAAGGPASVGDGREGLGTAETADGPARCWVRLGDDRGAEDLVASCMPIDPAVAAWSLFERVAPSLRLEEVPLAGLSFGLVVAGADL